MIAARDQYAVESTLDQTDKVAMGIRVEDMAHIMGVLTDLYSNKLLAVIREYSTNALDAQIEGGFTGPIEVTLPGALSPFFKVRDHGVGLSVDEIHAVYSQYGRSTKRASNDVVGMLGLGCKSALTYTTQFTVVSVKNGTQVTVAVSREADGSGSMTVVDTVSTDAANGTEVVVPINRADYWRAAGVAAQFYGCWKPGTVLVNGEAPVDLTEAAFKVCDGIYVTEVAASCIVMGNVPYPAPELDDLSPRGGVMAFVPIGAVNFPPNREALMDTKQTKATVAAIRESFATNAPWAVQREVDKAASPAEAVRAIIQWSPYLPGASLWTSAYTYKGHPLPTTILGPLVYDSDGTGRQYKAPFTVSSHGRHGRVGASTTKRDVPASDWPGTVWVEGYTPAKFNANHKKKLLVAADEAGIDLVTITQFACIPGKLDPKDPAMFFLDKARFLDWDLVRKIQLQARATRGASGRIPGSYDVTTETGTSTGIPGDKLRQEFPIYYAHGNEFSHSRPTEFILAHDKNATVVHLAANRIEKFARILPAASELYHGIRTAGAKWAKGITETQRLAIAYGDKGYTNRLAALDAKRVEDPALKAAIAVAKTSVRELNAKRTAFTNLVPIDLNLDCDDPFEKYPLLGLGHASEDHNYAYLNWCHATQK